VITMGNIIITKADEINQINDFIHDCWFDINRINTDDNSFKLYFTKYLETIKKLQKNGFLLKQFEIPEVECVLEIHEVKSYEIIDTEKVQIYDFNKLIFDQETNMITILTGIPLLIKIEVLSLKISVRTTDKVISNKKIWSF